MSNLIKRINYENVDWDKNILRAEHLIKEWTGIIQLMKLIRDEIKKQKEYLPLPETYIYFLVKTEIEKMKKLINSSTGRVSLNQKLFENWKVKLPPIELIEKFDKFCRPIFELQRKNEEIIRKLERLQKGWIESLS